MSRGLLREAHRRALVMTLHSEQYKPQAWRMTDYYPDSYAKFMSALGVGIDYSDDDFEKYRAEFMADLAEHDRQTRGEALRSALADIQAYTDAGAPFGHRPVEEFLLQRADRIEQEVEHE